MISQQAALCTPKVMLFMWQDDIIGVARCIDACLKRVYTSAGLPWGTRHLISPESAGKLFLIKKM